MNIELLAMTMSYSEDVHCQEPSKLIWSVLTYNIVTGDEAIFSHEGNHQQDNQFNFKQSFTIFTIHLYDPKTL